MVLTTHAVVGAAVAQLFPNNPVLGFGLAVTTHFVLDAIPHWEYPLKSLAEVADGKIEKNIKRHFQYGIAFGQDVLTAGLDFFVGLILALFIFRPTDEQTLILTLVGVAGGVLPDFLQFVHYCCHWRWLSYLQRFHIWIHAHHYFRKRYVSGIITQIALIALIIFVLK